MKSLRVGLKTGDLIGTEHRQVTIASQAELSLVDPEKPDQNNLHTRAGQTVEVVAEHGVLSARIAGQQKEMRAKRIFLHTAPEGAEFVLRSAATATSPAKPPMTLKGTLELTGSSSGIKVVLVTQLEEYVQGVLQSEVPSYFHEEAMKAQAVVARTYGLHPRLSHEKEGFNVCDSYLHCQAFYGLKQLSSAQQAAISSTSNLILLYEGKPALALFSACGGGHTESYQFCFSDPVTDAFPPTPISYLTGVKEGELPAGYPSEEALRKLFALPHPQTDDAWSTANFHWQVNFSADALEAHMHHQALQLMQDPQFAPFIHQPAAQKFGHIKGISIGERGVAGTAVKLVVDTTYGAWTFEKELTIRSLFENPDIKLKRLKSARVFFNHAYDRLGLLKNLQVCGFGSGHGVGLQQIGAQGLANSGNNWRQILMHYYPGAAIGEAL